MIKIICRVCGAERATTLGELVFSGIHLVPWVHIGFCPRCGRIRVHGVSVVRD